MADKNFGVKQINLIGASGTPTIESPNNLNIKAINVAISTDASVGGNISVGGSVVATRFIGDGSGLSNVIGTGSGVEIRNAGSLVGTASTIDFSDYFSVSAISAGIATVSLLQNPGGEGLWAPSSIGIHTTSNVGIGTTLSRVALTVVGNSIFSGIVTATSFSGNVPYASLSGVSTYSSSSGISTSVIGGIASVSQLTVSGISTIGYLDISNKIRLLNSDVEISGIGTFYLTNLSKIVFGNDLSSSLYYDGADLRVISGSNIRLGDNNFDYIRATSGQGVTLFHGSGTQRLSTLATGVSVNGNLSASGIVTAGTGFFGSGSSLSGIVTSLVAGDNITLSASTGRVTIAGRGDTNWTRTSVGINTLSNVGIGTTNPTDRLTVNGGLRVVGGSDVTGVATIRSGGIEFLGSSGNIKLGTGIGNLSGSSNIAIGDQSLSILNIGGGQNIAIGALANAFTSSGEYNISLGNRAGQNVTTGSYNVIIGSFTGNSGGLDIRTSSRNVVISDGEGNVRQYINSSGNVGIKTTVVTEALTVAGVVSATSFSGSGIGLTNIPASRLTGALPAIDGSALLGVIASGTGIVIEDDASPVGTAQTIDFGTNLSVSFSSGKATVSSASSVTEATRAYGLSGSPNLNVGIITATSFLGNASGTVQTGSTKLVAGIDYFDASSNGVQVFGTGRVNVYTSTSDRLVSHFTGSGNGNVNSRIFSNGDAQFRALSLSNNLTVSGIATATTFSGSAVGLTSVPASQLFGSLPAIDGSALLNVNASGQGIVVLDDNVNVGTAKTINFGTGLDVSYNPTTGIATVTGNSGSGLQTRTVVTGVTTAIPNLGIGNTDISGFNTYALMKVNLSTAGWIRLYTDIQSRENDATRSIGEDPAPGSGVIAEVVTTGISTTQIISPFVMGGDIYNDGMIYVSIQNLSGTTQTITANLTILQLEA